MSATGPEWPCGVPTKQGRPCPIPVPVEGQACHVHDPDGVYAKQHPKYRARLLASGVRPNPAAQLRAWPRLKCSLCGDQIPFGDPIRTMSMPVGPPAAGHPACVLDAWQLRGVVGMPAAP